METTAKSTFKPEEAGFSVSDAKNTDFRRLKRRKKNAETIAYRALMSGINDGKTVRRVSSAKRNQKIKYANNYHWMLNSMKTTGDVDTFVEMNPRHWDAPPVPVAPVVPQGANPAPARAVEERMPAPIDEGFDSDGPDDPEGPPPPNPGPGPGPAPDASADVSLPAVIEMDAPEEEEEYEYSLMEDEDDGEVYEDAPEYPPMDEANPYAGLRNMLDLDVRRDLLGLEDRRAANMRAARNDLLTDQQLQDRVLGGYHAYTAGAEGRAQPGLRRRNSD